MTSCIWEPTGKMRGDRHLLRCKACGKLLPSRSKDQGIKTNCAAAGNSERSVRLIHNFGPGTELSAIFRELGLKPNKSCGCAAKARQMDAWGISGCKEHRGEILAWMKEAYAQAGWVEKSQAAWQAVSRGLPLTLEGLLDLAIERAEAKASIIKVAFLSPALLIGGAERWIASLCRHFDPAKVWPTAIALVDYKSRSPMVEGWLPKYTRIVPADSLQSVMNQVDVLISWGVSDLAARTKGAKCQIVEVQHGTLGFGDQQRRLAQSGIDANAHLAAVGKACLENFPEEYRSKVTVIENGAEVDRLHPIEGREVTRNSLGILPGEKVCLFIGRIAAVKNLVTLAAAVRLLPGWRLVVAGPAYSKPDLGDAIVLPPREHLGDLFAAAEVFCAPSYHEANSLAVLEAMLAGVPTVTTNYPAALALQERHGAMSVLVDLNPSPQTLANAIEAAACGTLAEKAKRIAEENYKAEKMTKRWEEFLCRLKTA